MKRTPKHRPLRFTLSVVITVLLVVVSLTILAIAHFNGARSLLELSRTVTVEIADRIGERIDSLLGSAKQANALVSRMVALGTFDPSDGPRVLDVMAAMLDANEGFSSVEIGLSDGSKYKAEREADGGICRFSDVRTRSNVVRTYYPDIRDGSRRHADSVTSLERGYDARKRPWFVKAINAGATTWTDMYVAGTSKQFAYACATPLYGKGGELIAVVAVTIRLADLSHFLGTLKILDHGTAFVVNDRDQLVALPITSERELDRLFKPTPDGSEEPFQLYSVDEIPDRNIRRAVQSYHHEAEEFFEMEGEGGEANLAGLIHREGTAFTIGIVFPRRDVLGDISRNTRWMLLGVAAFLVVAVLVGMRVANRISSSLAHLCEEVDKVSRLELDSTQVVSSQILEVARIDDSVRNMRRGLRSFKKYVPLDLVVQLNALKKEASLEGEKRRLTIFFSDIADFTSISERLTPEELVHRLGVYFHGISRIVLDELGTLDKYIGDAVMAFWGAPVARENHAKLACATALKCQAYLDRVGPEWAAAGHPVFRTRIGIHTGEVIVGNIGSEERMNYTIIGEAANLASRLEGLNKFYRTRIIISEATYALVRDDFIARRLDAVAVKGSSRGIVIYELVAARGEPDEGRDTFLRAYDGAMEHYLARRWAEAGEGFAIAQRLALRGEDYPCELFVARCEEFRLADPGPDWSGVYAHLSK